MFAEVVCYPHGVAAWPERLAIDAVSFVTQAGPPRRTLYLLVAIGYDPPEYEPRLWLVRPSPPKDRGAWEDFFDLLISTPRQMVADMDPAIDAAVAARFPRPGNPAPEYRWSDYHVKRALDNVLAPLHDDHPLLAASTTR